MQMSASNNPQTLSGMLAGIVDYCGECLRGRRSDDEIEIQLVSYSTPQTTMSQDDYRKRCIYMYFGKTTASKPVQDIAQILMVKGTVGNEILWTGNDQEMVFAA